MLRYLVFRTLWAIPLLIAVSFMAFSLISWPPGDFVTSLVARAAATGETVDPEMVAALRARYGLDQSFLVQYWKWISGIVVGDFGRSFEWSEPVSNLIWDRMGYTLLLTVLTLMFTWIVALPIGIYSAVRQYSIGDYIFSTIGFLGIATPNFLLALIGLYIAVVHFGVDLSGFQSGQYLNAPWSWGRFVDLLNHLWLPVLVLGTAGTASLIKVMRANLLDELRKPYVEAARARGLSEFSLIMKYPVRLAINPFISTVGWILPQLVSGSIVVSIVLSLPTAGPLLWQALQSQDMYLAGAFILLLSFMTIIGTLISDLLLAAIDPRIRYGNQ